MLSLTLMWPAPTSWGLVAVLAVGAAACYSEGYDTSRLPEGVRADYVVFADRCSRCHSLSRPLSAGIDDDVFWKRYVETMRLKPGSGISVADEAPILRFLHYYSTQRKRDRQDQSTATPAISLGDAAAEAM
jgi:hypothetical protein